MKDNKIYDVIVVGGGASGMFVAGRAGELGKKVLLLEKMKNLGKKLAITGKGRCNITNISEINTFLQHFNMENDFLNTAFEKFFSEETILFFKKLGLETVTERGKRVFPKSQKAKDVVLALKRYLKKNQVKILYESKVKKFLTINNEIKAIQLENKQVFTAKSFVLATGGASYPLTGSTGDGYHFAKKMGHQIIPIRPSLVPFEIHENRISQRLDRLLLKNVNVSVFVNGEKENEKFGELQFYHFGIAGATILKMSRQIVDDLRENKKVKIIIDLKPALSKEKLLNRLNREIVSDQYLSVQNLLRKLIPLSLIDVVLEFVKIEKQRQVNLLEENDKHKIIDFLKSFVLNIKTYRPFSEAIITAGGINTNEINSKTMKSKIIKNLFFAGEIMDIDADTGGYNLQSAFSTAYLAGNNC